MRGGTPGRPAVNVTIDASVWVAARFASEPGHGESTEFLLQALGTRDTIVLPLLAIVECVAAVARKTENSQLATEVGMHLHALPAVSWVALDKDAVATATEVASEYRLRAADAVYAAVARSYGATLVTLDVEMRSRLPAHIRCLSPAEWTARYST